MSGLLGVSSARPINSAALHESDWRLGQHVDERLVQRANSHAWACISALPHDGADRQVHRGDGVVAAVFGTVWKSSERNETAVLDAERLAAAYLDRGLALLADLYGEFALAISIDRPDRREVLVATDRLGIVPMCLAYSGERIAFGSRADAVAALMGDEALSHQALYDYLYFHVVPAPHTIFRSVQRLLPGTAAVWRNGTLLIQPYWQPRYQETSTASVSDLRPVFLDALRSGVARSADGATVGAFLSGGTDSSTVSGLLGTVTGAPARTFSIGFDAAGYDEMAYARIAARKFATQHREYYVTPDDVVRAVGDIAAAHDQPFGNASIVPAYYCAKLAKEHGVERLLAGDGGDELYGGNSRYAAQYIFSLYAHVPKVLRRGLVEPALAMVPPLGLLRKARGYVDKANTPLPDRLQTYNLLTRIGPAAVLNPDFLATVDQDEPLHLLRDAYNGAYANSALNRMLALDLRFTLADSDLPKVNRACELAGVQVAYPLLAPEVVDFSLSLHPQMKLRRTRLRYFFKEALRDFLPRETLEKEKHGFGLPFGVWLGDHPGLRQLAGDALSTLRRRGLISEELLSDLLSYRIREHAGYYGTLVWILLTLELWLASHESARSAAPVNRALVA